MDDATAEKVARNNAVFRDVNEKIASAAGDLGLEDDRPVPFICECSNARCSQIILLTLEEYQRVRSNPRWFAHVPGHDSNLPGAVRMLEDHERYALAEKVAHAGDVAARLADPAGT